MTLISTNMKRSLWLKFGYVISKHIFIWNITFEYIGHDTWRLFRDLKNIYI